MADQTLDMIRQANPGYAGMTDAELASEFAKSFPEDAHRVRAFSNTPGVDAELTIGGPAPTEGTDWRRLAEIGGKRFGEGAGATVGLPATLAGLIAKVVESGGDESSLGQEYIRDFADKLMQMGQIPVDLWRKAVGKAPEPQGLAEQVVGNVAEVAGGASVPLLAGQGAVIGAGRSALQAGGRAALAEAARTGATAQVTMLQKLASMPVTQLAKLEAYLATGAGAGRTAGEVVTPKDEAGKPTSSIPGVVGELVGGFGLLGARNVLAGIREMIGSTSTRAGAKTRVGRQLAEAIPPGSRFEQNLDEAIETSATHGTQPTLVTATQSPSAVGIERQVTTRLPGTAERIAERRSVSEGAVRQAGMEIAGPGPGTVETARTSAATSLAADRQTLARTTAELQTQLAGYVDNASKAVQAQVTAAGPIAGREGAGEAILAALKQHESTAKLAAGRLFDRVDPENAVRLPTQGIRDRVAQVVAEGGESLRADTVPAVVRRLEERLSENTLASRLEKQGISPEAAARAGIDTAGGSDVPFNQLRKWRSDLLGELRDQSGSLTPNHQAIRNLNRVLESVEGTLDQTAALGSDAALRYREAAGAYRAYAEQFRQGVVADVLRRGPRGEEVRKNVEDIAGSFFKGRAGGPSSSARDFVAAVGDDALARRGLRDYAIGDFLRSSYDGGVLNTKRANAWFSSHRESLTQFPDVEVEIREVMRRGRNYDEVQGFVKGADESIEAARRASANELDRSAASAFVGADSDRAVAAIMTGQDRQKKMAELVGRMQGDEAAVRGLRRAVWDHLSAADFDASLNKPMLDPSNLRQRIEDNAAVLRTVYTPAQMGELKQVARVAELAVKPQAASSGVGGQIPPTDFEARQIYTMQSLHSRAWAAARWTSTQFVVADAFARKVTNVFDQMSARQLREVWNAAVLDPRVARKLLEMGRADFNEKAMTTTLKGFIPGMMERGTGEGE